MKKRIIPIIVIVSAILLFVVVRFLVKGTDDYKLVNLYSDPIKENQIYNNYRYNEYKDHVGIMFYEGNETVVAIPSKINNKDVYSIDDSAFYGKTKIEKIIVPDSVIYIGHQTFIGNNSLKEIILPDNILEIGEHAFDVCNSLERIYVKKDSKTEESLKETNFYKYIYYK